MLSAFRYTRREKQNLCQGLEIWGRLAGRFNLSGCNRRQSGLAGILKIAWKANDLERGIDLEEKGFVLPIEKMRVEAQAVVRMLGPAVILPRRIDLIVLAQGTAP